MIEFLFRNIEPLFGLAGFLFLGYVVVNFSTVPGEA